MIRAISLLAAVLAIGAAVPQSESIDLGGGVTLDVVKISAGSFEMGSPSGEVGRGPDEEQHQVTIAEDFWIGRTPVTRGQFARFVQESGYRTEAEKGTSGGFGFDGTALVQKKDFNWRNPGFVQTDDHPVVIVTYDDALAFAGWLERKSGRRVTLPTEAQWEYACRAKTTSRFYSGDSDADVENVAWFKKNSGNGTRPVSQKAANAFGLYDMSGNVYQWCSDLYAAYVTGGGVQGPMDKPRRVLRGGSWLKDAKHVRSAARARNTPGSRNADNGFRIVVGAKASVPPPVPTPATVPTPRPTPPPPPEPTPAPPEPYTAPAEPTPYREPIRRKESGEVPMGCIIVLVGAFVVLAIVVLLIRRSRHNSRPVPPYQPPPPSRPLLRRAGPRIVDDGFWFNTYGYSSGDLVTYTYTGPSGIITEQFLVDPSAGEQFVYTGERPGDVVLGPTEPDEETPPPPLPTPIPPPIIHDDDRPRRYPPAY